MTAPRQVKKPLSVRALALGRVAIGGAAGMPVVATVAATTERVVTARHSGLALFGFDPVAYFTDAAAVPGLPELEVSHAGAVWRFHNVGNRAAFLAAPQIYMP